MKRGWGKREREQRRKEWLKHHETVGKASSTEPQPPPSRRNRKQKAVPIVEYYSGAFQWMHSQLWEKYPNGFGQGKQARIDFWHLVPDGVYGLQQAEELVSSYSSAVERRLAEEVRTHSLLYWMHIYRRLSPHPIGRNNTPSTTMLVRQRLDVAFQKFAPFGPDKCIGWSDEVNVEDVLSDVPVDYRPLWFITRVLKGPRQPLLTKFGIDNLIQLYRCEELAYEIWKCGATARIVSKGANLVVDHTVPECFFDNRSEELNELVTIYDDRESPFIASATASVFEARSQNLNGNGTIILPTYNVKHVDAKDWAFLFKKLGVSFRGSGEFNFNWTPFDVKSYAAAHAPLGDAFARKHGFRFEAVMIILMSLIYRTCWVWSMEPTYIYQSFQRAHTGPSKVSNVRQFIDQGIAECAEILEVQHPSSDEIDRAIDFLTLTDRNRNLISLSTGGPSFFFLPTDEGEVITDFAWVITNLQYLFFGVPLHDKGTKGKLLESLVSRGESILPDEKCKGLDGSSREVDAAIRIGRSLVLVECKANARSIGYERGDLNALNYRRQAFEEALRQADDKAAWLSTHPIGTNYNISEIQAILPVVVTPFKEFMPSLNSSYWVRPKLPRVLLPNELQNFLADTQAEPILRQSRSTVFLPALLGKEAPTTN